MIMSDYRFVMDYVVAIRNHSHVTIPIWFDPLVLLYMHLYTCIVIQAVGSVYAIGTSHGLVLVFGEHKIEAFCLY